MTMVSSLPAEQVRFLHGTKLLMGMLILREAVG